MSAFFPKKRFRPLHWLALATAAMIWQGTPSSAEAGIGGKFYAIDCVHISFDPYGIQSFEQVASFKTDGTFHVAPSGATGTWTEVDYFFFSQFSGTFDAGGELTGIRIGNRIYMYGFAPDYSFLQICSGVEIRRVGPPLRSRGRR